MRQLGVCWVCSSLLFAGCTSMMQRDGDPPSGPAYVGWLPASYKTPVDQQLPKPKEQWWRDFGSAELSAIIETALNNNFDLRIAIARVSQTRAQADIVKSAQYPTVDANLRYGIQGPTPGPGYAANTAQWNSQPLWQAGALVSYEVDIWGKKGFDTKSAFSQALASEFNRQAVALSLVGDVMTVYFQIVSLDERIAVAERNLETIRGVGRGLERRVDLGDATLIDLSQQLILQNNTDALVTSLKLQRERAINRLAALMGTTSSAIQIKAKSVEEISAPVVSPGLPSDLLCRRPDIRRAEASLEGAEADLLAARASLFPTFTITGGGGYGSFLLSQLTMPQSLFYNITSNLVQNIFDAGKRRAQIQLASAKNVELLEGYANTVVGAMRDVEDGLASVALTAQAYAALNDSRNRAQRLAVMSAKVVEKGGMDYVQLYEIQRTVIASEDAAITARGDQLIASVNLYKAIGGGMKLENDPCLGGGTLPQANASWIEKANKADSVFGSKPDLVIGKSGKAAYRGSDRPLPGTGLEALASPLGQGDASR
ncbi:MAG: efflux transporter outer membrane subunit [Polynucleobacter sp.]|nr:efflux transporter outer membrane subunit [Polynucleobacter sp.]MDZ4057314.1 efflux transporter outer membrane subunit [Polynucleobacter sp.]